MDRNELMEWMVIFGVYGWMIISGVVFHDQRTLKAASDIASMAGMVGFLLIKEAYIQVAASKYDYYRCVVRPKNNTLHLFAKKGGFDSIPSIKNPNFFTTTLPLGVKTKIEPYGNVERVVLKHEFPFEKRVITAFGKCNYKGNIVDHRGTATLIVYEYPEASSDVDHSEPIPTFYLKDAPGDYMIGPITPFPTITGNVDANVIVQKVARKTLVLEQALGEKTRQARYWHEQAIKFEGALELTKQELSAKLQDRPEHMRGVYRHVASLYNDEDKLKQLKSMGSIWRSFLKPWMLIPVMAGLILAFLAYQPKVLEGVNTFCSTPSNQIWIIIIAIIMVAGIYYFGKLYKKRKA